MEIRGKTILITGGARRIGRAVALALAGQGARIVLHYHHSAREARTLVAAIRKQGGEAEMIRESFSGTAIAARVEKFVKKVRTQAGPIDVLINNASVFYPTEFGRIREKDWDDLLTVNLKAPFFLAQAFGRSMKKRRKGKIINLLDWTVTRPPVRYLPYAISKAGLEAATLGLARVLAPEVQVNGIAPGPILPSGQMTAREKRLVAQKSLLKRFGDPEDIARTVLFLLESDYITGAVVPVEGGSRLA